MEQFFDAMTRHLRDQEINLYRVSMIRGDGDPVTRQWVPCNPNQNSYSCAKAFTLTAIGFLWQEDKLRLEDPVTQHLAPYLPADLWPKWRDITIDTVIRHRSGLPGGFLDIDCCDASQLGDDYLGHILRYPIDGQDRYAYSDGAYYLLARVVAACAGMPIVEYLWQKLFLPLGFREVAWSCCPQGYAMGATGLYLRTEDLVKLGAVYLNRGLYQGRRILSEQWVDTVLQRGYLHTYGTHGAFGHAGMLGQMLMVLPEQNLALAWHGFTDKNPKTFPESYFYGSD